MTDRSTLYDNQDETDIEYMLKQFRMVAELPSYRWNAREDAYQRCADAAARIEERRAQARRELTDMGGDDMMTKR